MSDQEQNVDVIKRGYDAFSTGDMETMMSLFDDNIEWSQPGDSAISGTYHGKGELGDYFRRLGEKPMTVKPIRFIAEGDTVVVLSDVTVGGESGHGAEVFTLRDGKTIRAQLYEDTALMERVYGKKQVSAG
ncbi:DUF4440 domain-containing protein [Mycobacterium sp. 1164966.3]|uniref:nuclear transport factor 2 family protein n=1 Tax=Mycobacterium sp. 1164966.3 TaxID=1856861 RepID=UPI0007FC1FFF|nr:nuclear transport factor 2 family protein [Mycobacterium sp. 1164966.3]OBA81595.1 DUF4440 domain-containing protein [Mycobacterium sp. 1164966.3]